jgi:hypothetical protein
MFPAWRRPRPRRSTPGPPSCSTARSNTVCSSVVHRIRVFIVTPSGLGMAGARSPAKEQSSQWRQQRRRHTSIATSSAPRYSCRRAFPWRLLRPGLTVAWDFVAAGVGFVVAARVAGVTVARCAALHPSRGWASASAMRCSVRRLPRSSEGNQSQSWQARQVGKNTPTTSLDEHAKHAQL